LLESNKIIAFAQIAVIGVKVANIFPNFFVGGGGQKLLQNRKIES
jgi:hypothetical protein